MCVSSSQDGKLEFDEFKEMMETNSRNKAAAAAATATVAAMALKKGPALKNAALAAASANRRKSSGNPEATKASGSTEVPTTSSTGTAATGNPRYVCSHQKKSFVFPKINFGPIKKNSRPFLAQNSKLGQLLFNKQVGKNSNFCQKTLEMGKKLRIFPQN